MSPAKQRDRLRQLGPFRDVTYDFADEHTVFATIDFFGRPHHAMFVRVRQAKTGELVGTKDPHDRVEDIYRLYDVPLVPVSIPGFPGKWLIVVHPWGD
jgi:hypothetical protein